ncbi:PRC-barrel domain-containing protein [Desertibaculum subflavum]|uniref:PRC-barrel domain-containing protein n=1 Tax=Desertibaculum subflavum TaxID=2268458 RepID=UPI000E660445
MLWRLDHLRNFKLHATDGRLGSIVDVYFDDQDWQVRWLVVDTAWLFGRRVLLAPPALGRPDEMARELPISLTQEKIKHAPDVSTDKPVSRQNEASLYAHYAWPPYWAAGVGAWTAVPVPPAVYPLPNQPPAGGAPPMDRGRAEALAQEEARRDPHLRSGREVTGYHIAATDGGIGHVEDVLIDDDGWRIRYLVIDTRNWLPGRKVIVAPTWVREISWPDRQLTVALTREQVEQSPEFNPQEPPRRDYEGRLYKHYGQTVYWE